LALDPAAVLAYDAEDHRQAQPGTLADLLGGVERLKDPGQDIGWDTLSRVAHTQTNKLPRATVCVLLRLSFIQHDILRFEDELATLRHCISGI
jgi:hypothetical protein